MASQFRKRRKIPVVASTLVGKKRFKRVKRPLVYPPVASTRLLPHSDPDMTTGGDSQSPAPEATGTSAEYDMDPVDLDTYDDDDHESTAGAKSAEPPSTSAHYRRREKAATAWDKLAQSFIDVSISPVYTWQSGLN